jgi:hypothetical protein
MGGTRHAPSALTPAKRYDAHCGRGWEGTWAGLEGSRKSRTQPVFDLRTVSESLYRLSYPGPQRQVVTRKKLWFDPYYNQVVCVIQRHFICYDLGVNLFLCMP